MAYLKDTELGYGYEDVNTIGSCRLVLQSNDDADEHFFKRFVIGFVCDDVLAKTKKLPPYVSLELLQADIVAVTDLASASTDGYWCVRKAVTLCVHAVVVNDHKDDYDDDDIPTDLQFYFRFYVSRSLRDLSLYVDKEVVYDHEKKEVYRQLFNELNQVFNAAEPMTKTVKRSDDYNGKTETYFVDFTDDLF